MFIELAIFIVVLLVSYFIWNRVQRLQLRDNLDIPGPKPNFIFGNMNIIMANGKVNPDHAFMSQIQAWRQQYGDYFGYYLGPQLQVILFDLDLAKEVFIKQFDCFVDRQKLSFNERRIIQDSLVNASGDKWKHIRNSVTPTFTASKMKQMSLTIHDKLDTLLNQLQGFCDRNETFDIYDKFQALTLDVIGECAFGVKVHCQTDPNDQFLLHCQNFFRSLDYKANSLLPVSLFFPEFGWLIKPFIQFTEMGREETWLINLLKKVVNERKQHLKQEAHKVDILQLLLDQQEEEMTDAKKGGETKGWKGQTITDDAILGNAFVFLIAGYETTSTALGYTAWLLAKNRDVQTKLQKEIDDKLATDDLINYDAVHKLPYLDAVLHEALRVYPPVIHLLSRTCVKECQIGPVHFLPGMQVNVQNYQIHHDPDIWADPEKFDPERFIDTTYSNMSWLPFGVGPRNCVGMRFADMEYKMALVRILSRFNIVFGPDSEDPLQTQETSILMRPKNGVHVRIEKR